LKGIISTDWFVMNHCQQSFLLYLCGAGERTKCLWTQESITAQRRLVDQVRSIYLWSVFVINVKFLYLNVRKRNLEIAFLRYSRDFVTSVIIITEFDCTLNSVSGELNETINLWSLSYTYNRWWGMTPWSHTSTFQITSIHTITPIYKHVSVFRILIHLCDTFLHFELTYWTSL
jgi:hypothetical protein